MTTPNPDLTSLSQSDASAFALCALIFCAVRCTAAWVGVSDARRAARQAASGLILWCLPQHSAWSIRVLTMWQRMAW
eukprot:CAMPEP_0174378750 /NCGR_PEP_ID=MMETSP0811_2-20130205/122248_1 /TAXON_ID=73025 ORGANISM="Eutreptiella gymnastica-like, Strain CCMP1594" /NCGR_SAMPLE_ID=MMETSP0811_2 /ASSEMBLY_ACC=CAM_ASM_000667 /LENGTH=76 /DNA_ID=CAMNT_0015531047 /DNA_START=2808 /DNA_END=3035 /DNA_ORIENTATION=+